jgi:1L-myo-inositol 1-phosphate cytidylyltransferase / CDP-L-myo-inositol myo-inositolphosphotransferase
MNRDRSTEPTGRLLDTAVMVTAFPATSKQTEASAVSPLIYIAGLPLVLRSILALQRAGVQRIIILAGAEAEQCKRMVAQHRRISIRPEWRPISKFPVHEPRTWAAFADEIRDGFVVVGPHAVLSPAAIDLVRRELHAGEILALSSSYRLPIASEPPVSADLVAVSPMVMKGFQKPGGSACDMPENTDPEKWPFACLIQQGADAGRLRQVPVGSSCVNRIRSRADISGLERALLDSLRLGKAEFEGVVDAHLNRHISRPLTHAFLKLGLSPNMITGVSTIIGLLAAGVFALGSYSSGVAGALLLQLSAIVDCCDGEVARITFGESRFGARLDLFADNVVHLALFGGLSWGMFVNQAGGSMLPLWLGAAAMVANVLSFWLVMRSKRLRDSNQLSSEAQAARVDVILKKIASRDFSVVLIIFALVNRVEWFLWIAALGSNAFWIMLAWLTRPSTLRTARTLA